MKFIIVALAIILMAQSSFASSPQFVQLSKSDINKSQLIQNLRDLGADYVIQQGVFVSTKSPLPGNFYELTKTVSVEQKVTSSITYYRYNVILYEQDKLAIVKATYTVSFKPSTGGFLVTNFKYTVIGGNPNNQQSVGGPSLIDVRPLNKGNDDLSPLLAQSIKYVVADAKKNDELPRSKYELRYVYNAYLVNSGYPAQYVFLVKLTNSKGQTYRVQITATEDVQGQPHVNPTYVVYPNA